jgi:Uncharacterized conserved protein
MVAYIALVRKQKRTSFGVEFPDFPGCISAADTLDEAVENAKEALVLHVEGMLEDDEPVPEPSSLEEICRRKEFKGAIPVLIDVPLSRYCKRINITIDERLLKRIDQVAAKRGTSRSGFLTEAARERIKRS